MRISDWSSDVCSSDLQTFAESHERRLEAMRRLTRNVVREPDGSWIIAPDHLDRAAAHEAARTKDRPVIVDSLSPLPLELGRASILDRVCRSVYLSVVAH